MKTKILLTSMVAILATGSAFAAGDGVANIDPTETYYPSAVPCDTSILDTTVAGATVALQAMWHNNTYTVNFDKNDSDAVEPNPNNSATCTYYDTRDATTPSTTTCSGWADPVDFTLTGHILTGWNTATDGTGTDVSLDSPLFVGTQNLATGASGDNTVDLYAQWGECSYTGAANTSDVQLSTANNTCSYTVTCATGYHLANGVSDTVTGTPGSAAQLTLPDCIGNTINMAWDPDNGDATITGTTCDYGTPFAAPTEPTRTGYTFVGWDVVDVNE